MLNSSQNLLERRQNIIETMLARKLCCSCSGCPEQFRDKPTMRNHHIVDFTDMVCVQLGRASAESEELKRQFPVHAAEAISL
jgi:hypothetical protein